MLIAAFPAGPWGTNCYVAATGAGTECVVVDPGYDAAAGVADLVREHRLKPVAVLLTHGHVDHMWSVTPIAGTYDATAWVHPADRHLLTDPLAGMSQESRRMLMGGLLGEGHTFAEPDDVRELADGQGIELAGLSLIVDHTPGHTEGSVTFRTAGLDTPARSSRATRPPAGSATRPTAGSAARPPELPNGVGGIMFAGDLLFEGSIGRTDLPGGNDAAMRHSLATKVLPLADDIVVLPGHGRQTSIGRERATNPFLQDLITT